MKLFTLSKNKLLIVLGLSSMIALSGCNVVAEMTGADTHTLNLIATEGYQKMLQEARASNKLDTSSMTYRRINSVFNKMRSHADRLNKTGHAFDWKLAVLKSDEVNAYVAPGGKVVFYSGIVEKLQLTDDEIGAIMGHEMIHALEEHAKSKIGAQTLTGLAVQIGASAAGLGQAGTALADLGSQVGVGLPYSRNLETRADQGGLMLMAEAGYNPNAAITLWQKMQAHDGKEGLTFLSTHPSNQNRIEAMRKNLPTAMNVYLNRSK